MLLALMKLTHLWHSDVLGMLQDDSLMDVMGSGGFFVRFLAF
jgi:hypothetical protein